MSITDQLTAAIIGDVSEILAEDVGSGDVTAELIDEGIIEPLEQQRALIGRSIEECGELPLSQQHGTLELLEVQTQPVLDRADLAPQMRPHLGVQRRQRLVQ